MNVHDGWEPGGRCQYRSNPTIKQVQQPYRRPSLTTGLDSILSITSPLKFLAEGQDSFLLTRSRFYSCSLSVLVDAWWKAALIDVGPPCPGWQSLRLEAWLGNKLKGSFFSKWQVVTISPVNCNVPCRRPQGQTVDLSVLCGALICRKGETV